MSEVSRVFGWCSGPANARLHCESCRVEYVGGNGVTYRCSHVCHQGADNNLEESA